jgi:hypothetical protein
MPRWWRWSRKRVVRGGAGHEMSRVSAKQHKIDQSRILVSILSELDVPSSSLWTGAHIVLRDDVHGRMWNRWRRLASAYPRWSSHHRTSRWRQYAVAFGPHEFLFGRTVDGQTWFQMERSRASSWLWHGLDFLESKITDRNIGPTGTSLHTEARPLDRFLCAKCRTATRCVGTNL